MKCWLWSERWLVGAYHKARRQTVLQWQLSAAAWLGPARRAQGWHLVEAVCPATEARSPASLVGPGVQVVFWTIASFMKAGPPGLWPQWVMTRAGDILTVMGTVCWQPWVPSHVLCACGPLTWPAWGPASVCPQMKKLWCRASGCLSFSPWLQNPLKLLYYKFCKYCYFMLRMLARRLNQS